jgi:TonB-dependent SusC/RagA subfamily outer membrane receptor
MEKYFLHINEPCTQDWDKMTPASQGKFCNNCSKIVFDFTSATDNEIIKHIEKIKGEEFCGKFEEHQLDRWIGELNINKSNHTFYKLLLSFLIISGGQNIVAQNIPKQEKIVLKQRADSILNELAIKSEVPDIICDTPKSTIFQDTRIRLGGVRTISKKDNPLVIVDGLPIKMSVLSKIDPNEIKSIDILKSKEATAIYGADGVNGVILITSKNPKKAKSTSKLL